MPANVSPPGAVIRRTALLAEEGARFVLDEASAALAGRGLFRLGLAGGNTPRAVYEELARTGKDLAWDRVQITFGDERCVPPESAESNFHMAQESLLRHVPIPPGNVFRMRGEIPQEEAAQEYEAQLSAFAARMGETRYRHDLLLLGLGEDGHTASLFPESSALSESARNVIPVIGPKPPPERITFTLPLINASRHICFLTKTAGKEAVLNAVISGEERYPAARVRPEDGTLTWLIGAEEGSLPG